MLLVHVNELEDEKALFQNLEVKPTCNKKLLLQTVAELGVVIFNALDFGLICRVKASVYHFEALRLRCFRPAWVIGI